MTERASIRLDGTAILLLERARREIAELHSRITAVHVDLTTASATFTWEAEAEAESDRRHLVARVVEGP